MSAIPQVGSLPPAHFQPVISGKSIPFREIYAPCLIFFSFLLKGLHDGDRTLGEAGQPRDDIEHGISRDNILTLARRFCSLNIPKNTVNN